MSRLNVNPNLHHDGVDSTFLDRVGRTYAGMAHFAGTGPDGATCRLCAFWSHSSKWSAPGVASKGEPMPARCGRFTQLTRKKGATVPHDAPACRHFQAAANPQPIKRPKAEWEA